MNIPDAPLDEPDFSAICPSCKGLGILEADTCPTCRGLGDIALEEARELLREIRAQDRLDMEMGK